MTTDYVIEVKITDKYGDEVKGIKVSLITNKGVSSIKTDSNGIADFGGVPGGDHTITLYIPK